MTNRFNAKGVVNYGEQPLPTGYAHDEGSSTSTFIIPSCGIEDVDASLFTLFDKEIKLQVGGNDSADMKKVPVIFGAGERWAMIKNGRPLRDKNGTLILPLITIVRTNIEQTMTDDIGGRGINQHTGEIVIRRKLDNSDRGYQSLINRTLLQHQSNIAVDNSLADVGQLTTTRSQGDESMDPTIIDGGELVSDRSRNVYETLVVPSPQFYTAKYEITIWTQYTQHTNQLLETIISSFLPQTRGWKLDTTKGYWFVATVSDDSYEAATNFDDMTTAERFIKYKFNVSVPAYVFASSAPGVPLACKKYISCPDVSFDISIPEQISGVVATDDPLLNKDDPFFGSDDPTLPLANDANARRDQRMSGHTRLFTSKDKIDPHDPALASLPRGRNPDKYRKFIIKDVNGHNRVKWVRVAGVNSATGETTYQPGIDLGGLTLVISE